MHCPFCNATETKVTDSRLVSEGNQVRRRRECLSCHERYTTYEKAELAFPAIIKRNGEREPFNEQKLRRGIDRAIEKRVVATESVDSMIHDVKQLLRASGEREIPAKQLGEWVMKALRGLDEVAFVRFASVYRSFRDVNEFNKEIARMQEEEEPENVSV